MDASDVRYESCVYDDDYLLRSKTPGGALRMSDHLVFMMGQFEALFPTDRLYATNHMWALPQDDVYRFGFTAYAVRLLQDVYFLDWAVEPGARLRKSQEIGLIESKKAESSLFAPIPGELTSLNEELLSDPSTRTAAPPGGTQ